MSAEGQSSVVSLVQQVPPPHVTLPRFRLLRMTPLQLKAGSITKEELFAKLSSLQVNTKLLKELFAVTLSCRF